MVGYKVCVNEIRPTIDSPVYVLVELEIPEDAVVFAFSDEKDKTLIKGKRRTNKVTVRKIHGNFKKVYPMVIYWSSVYGIYKNKEKEYSVSEYEEGKTYVVENFLNDGLVQCGPGIHFFEFIQDLKDYVKFPIVED